MSDREAFEKWAKGLLDLQRIGPFYGDEATQTAFEAWQAALESGEPAGQVYFESSGAISVNWFDANKLAECDLLYTATQPVVPEGYVPVPKSALDGALYLAGLAVAHTDFGSQHRADFKVCCEALLSAGKETV
jgi:hypothetical protein